MAAPSGNTGWAQLRQQARSLETQVGAPPALPPGKLVLTGAMQTETLFQTYSQFSQVPDIPQKPTEEEKATEAKLEEILEKVSRTPNHLPRRRASRT